MPHDKQHMTRMFLRHAFPLYPRRVQTLLLVQGGGDAAQAGEGMSFITGRFKPADLLPGGYQQPRQFLLSQSGFFRAISF
jgi:hypothetical protein